MLRSAPSLHLNLIRSNRQDLILCGGADGAGLGDRAGGQSRSLIDVDVSVCIRLKGTLLLQLVV